MMPQRLLELSHIRFKRRKGGAIDGAMETIVLNIAGLEITDEDKQVLEEHKGDKECE